MRTLATELFREMVSRSAGEIDLAAAALLIALDEYPDLNLQGYLLKIDQLAERISPQLQGLGSVAERPVDVIEKMNQNLFAVEGFRGNQEDYYDPRNSFLNEVLDRRTGIPITLSVIYMEVGKRLGLDLQGVGMPGHFIVKCRHRDMEIFVDPFNLGEILLEADCRRKLAQIHGQDFQFDRSHLDPANNHQILTRILTNLKAVYFGKQDYSRTLTIIEKILLVNPDDADEIRDRGSVHYKLDHLSKALKDWSRYLELNPHASDANEIERNMKVAGYVLASRN
jgi:regulator of sirC expression with transglutaminase-like and TPR domain